MRAKRIFWGAVAGLAIVAMLPALGEAATIDPTAVSIGKAVSADGRYAVFERPTTLYYPSPGLNVYLEDLRAGDGHEQCQNSGRDGSRTEELFVSHKQITILQ